ncbi:MAG: hypothetical protein GXP48_01905 [Acidobacteria bacterium]|nr:hypothetical protein [Acidobacteriota bacterium]
MKGRLDASSGTGRGRFHGPVKVGCTGGVMLLTVLLFASFLFLNRGVRWTMQRARARLERSLPGELTPADRTRLENDLNRFFAAVVRDPDSTRRMGQFLGRVEHMLDDGRVTIPEVHDLCRFLERASRRPAPACLAHG